MGSEVRHPYLTVPDDWSVRRLKELTTKVGSGATPRGGKNAYVDEGVRLIRSQNVHDLRFEPAGLAHITDEAAAKLAGVEVQPNDVLLNITGASIARCCQAPLWALPARVNQHVAIVRPTAALDPCFLMYLLVHPTMREYVLSHNAGASREAITKRHIEDLLVPVPPIEEQQAIAEVLGALDDRIEWSGRLRASCVDLLTTTFSEAALQRVAVGDLADVVAGQSPPGSTYNTDGEGLPFFQGSAQFGALVPTVEKWCSAPQRVAERGDLLFSVRAPVGDLNVATEKVCIGRGLAAIRSPFRAAAYAALALASSAWSVHDGSGTVFGSINGRDLRATQVPWPDDVEALAPMLEALMDRALAADAEGRSLARTRDALLPQLLSGELRIECPARVLGAVA